MQSLWDETTAAKYSSALQQRVYSSRLLGSDPSLVLHGGGNTSVKDTYTDLLGETFEVLYVKGSGWDLKTIEEAGFAGVRLQRLLQLRQLDQLDDPNMVNELRTQLIDANAPTPSVETLLHAFIPYKFVDHTHAEAILTLTNQPDGEAICRDVFGDRVGIVPYVMPGFALSKLCAQVFEADPKVEGLVLLKHGLFTFGETAQQSYQRTVELVSEAQAFINRRRSSVSTAKVGDGESSRVGGAEPAGRSGSWQSAVDSGTQPDGSPGASSDAPSDASSDDSGATDVRLGRLMESWRGEMAKRGLGGHVILEQSPETMTYVCDDNIASLCQRGPITPDHVIRTKQKPLFISATSFQELFDHLPSGSGVTCPSGTTGSLGASGLSGANDDELASFVAAAVDRYAKAYEEEYFQKNCRVKSLQRVMLDPYPRVVVVEGQGVLCFGTTYKSAAIARDLYRQTARVVTSADAIGDYEALEDCHIFDMEYWVLEQAKLKLAPKKLGMSGKTALISGGASGIGKEIAAEMLRQGACVLVVDRDRELLARAAAELGKLCVSGNRLASHVGDVSVRDAMRAGVEKCVRTFGGIDIVVSNAGIFPPSAALEEIDGDQWQKSLDVNLTGSLNFVSEAVTSMKRQGTGGDVVFIASKNVLAPGARAGAYSVAKAGQAQLARVAAMEWGKSGIRVNTLHPHLVFDTALWSDDVVAARAAAYGMTPEEYRCNNLLKTELSSIDVAKAVCALSGGAFSKTTGAQIAVDGGSDRTI